MVLVWLQAELSDRKRDEAVLIHRQTMPPHQHMKSRHGERQVGLEILPDTVHHLLAVADQREHRQDGLAKHAIIPLPARTQFQMGGIPLRRREGGIAQDDHVLFKQPDERVKRGVMHIGHGTLPGDDQGELVQQQAQHAAHNPPVIREPLPPNLQEAPAFPPRMDQLDPVCVNDPQQRGGRQARGSPGLMSREQPKEPGALGQAGEQGPIVSRQPAIEGAIADAFEGMEQPQGDHLARPKGGLMVFRDGFHRLIDPTEDSGDEIHSGHVFSLQQQGFDSPGQIGGTA
jgi:hypothetical protein